MWKTIQRHCGLQVLGSSGAMQALGELGMIEHCRTKKLQCRCAERPLLGLYRLQICKV